MILVRANESPERGGSIFKVYFSVYTVYSKCLPSFLPLGLCLPHAQGKVKEETEKAGLNSAFKKRRSQHPVPSLHGK